MPGVAYVDSSALLTVAFNGPERAAVEADFADREGLVASALVVVECRRAARRHSSRQALRRVNDLLDALYLLPITAPILDQAAALAPQVLRSLDAIHLATALAIGDPDIDVVTYDDRLSAAAKASGLRVLSPGRP